MTPFKIVVFATLLANFVRIPTGLFVGYVGDAVDRIIAMIMDSIYTFSGLILAIAIVVMLDILPTNAIISGEIIYNGKDFSKMRQEELRKIN